MIVFRWKLKFRSYNGDIIIVKFSGSNIKLVCFVYGYFKSIIIWYKEDVLFDVS